MPPLLRRRCHIGAAFLVLAFGTSCTEDSPIQITAASQPGRLAPPNLPPESPARGPTCRAGRSGDVDPPAADAGWEKEIDRIVGGLSAGVAVGVDGRIAYTHEGKRPRAPASNEKLLLSMALFDLLGPKYRIPTSAAARRIEAGSITGNLWILGRGDPTLTANEPGYWGDLDGTTVAQLAGRIQQSGVKRIEGRVIGASDYFAHDLDARGWQPYVPHRYVQLPSSLVLNGNNAGPDHPERAVAAALTRELEKVGVTVDRAPRSGSAPKRLTTVAKVHSPRLAVIVGYMNRTSNNFFAEMLGKLLGAEAFGPPGTIHKGARVIERWMSAYGVQGVAHDSSGLSYENRVSPRGIVRLLGIADGKPWGKVLRARLPGPGEGTLGYRLAGLDVRAKTGTLFNGASALSGWVRTTRSGRWIEFSILDKNAPKSTEDRIVSTIARANVRAPRLRPIRTCAPTLEVERRER